MPLLEFILFIAAFAVLYESSRHVLNSSIKLSQMFGITEMAAGFIIIAGATSLPDFMVSVTAASIGRSAISLGDVLGSTIANIALVLGVASLIRNVYIKREQTLESAELLLFITLAPLLFILTGAITYREGTVLLLLFFIYVLFILKGRLPIAAHAARNKRVLFPELTVFIAMMVIVFASSHFVVEYGIQIAQALNVPDAIIGMTFIAFGTTLPELAVDFRAIRTGKVALAVGDIFGSCVINLTLVLGASAVISPITNGFLEIFIPPLVFLLALSSFLWYVLMKHEAVKKEHGLLLLIFYVLWLVFELTGYRVV